MATPSLGTRELDILTVLWTAGSGTVTEVQSQLPAPLAYTTVLTILRNLEQKGVVRHEGERRAHRYFPRLAREAALADAVQQLVDRMFGGSAEKLVGYLIRNRGMSKKDLKKIRRKAGKPDKVQTARDTAE